MSQIYDQLRYIPNIGTYILPKTPYFDPKKITRASFLFALAKFVLSVHPSIRRFVGSVRRYCLSVGSVLLCCSVCFFAGNYHNI
jgi:hypothetical protein